MANEMKFSNKVVFLNGNPILLPKTASDPSSGMVAGDLYYNTTSNVMKYYNGSAWTTLTTGSVSLTGQTLAEYSIIVGDGSDLSVAVDTQSGDVLADATGLNIALNVIDDSHISTTAGINPGKITVADGSIIVGGTGDIGAAVAMSGEATLANTGAITLDNDSVIGKVLTGFTSGAGTVAATDSILEAIQKLDGNISAVSTGVAGWKEAIPISACLVDGTGTSAGIRPGGVIYFSAQPAVGDTVTFTIDADGSQRTYTFVADQGSESLATDVSIESSASTAMARLAARVTADASKVVLAVATTMFSSINSTVIVLLLNTGVAIPTSGSCGVYGTWATQASCKAVNYANGTGDTYAIGNLPVSYVNNFSFGRRASALRVGEVHNIMGTDQLAMWNADGSTWKKFTQHTAGNGITIDTSALSATLGEIAVKVASNKGISVDGNGLAVDYDDSSIGIDGVSGKLEVKDEGISNSHISTTAAIVASKLSVTDGSIIVGTIDDVGAAVAMSGEATLANTGAITLDNDSVIGKVLTGFTSGSGVVAATDSILEAIQKLDGNVADKVAKAGDAMTGSLTFGDGYGIDTTDASDTLNIGSTNATTINIGKAGATVNIIGTLQYVQTTNLEVTDSCVTLNKGGDAGSGGGAGVEIEEDDAITAYIRVSGDRNSWIFKSPAKAGLFTVTPSSADTIFALSSTTSAKTVTFQDASGTVAYTSDIPSISGLATLALDNLASVAINTSLISDTNNTDDLGSDAIEWKDVWAHAIKHNDATNPDLGISTTGNNGSIIVTAHGTGSLDIKATKVRRSESGASANFMEDQYFDALTLSSNTTDPTAISALEFSSASFEGVIIDYKIKEATSAKVRVGKLFVAASGESGISSADQFSETDALGSALGLVLDASNSSGTVSIRFNNTHASNACTMRCQVRRIRA